MRFVIWGLLFSANLLCAAPQTYVTYDVGGGRFGDHLIEYLHAKWLSFHYQVPLLYKPFIYSSELVLSDRERYYTHNFAYGKHYPIRDDYDTSILNIPGVYVCPYFPENRGELRRHPQFHFDADWKNPEFRKLLLALIAPKKELDLFKPPPGTIGIAIHVREGGGYDDDNTRIGDGLRLPPLEFYVRALPEVLELFPGRRVYCRIFTDAHHPETIAEALAQVVSPSVQIDYRKETNHENANVLEDFFSLFYYDVLIRPQSNFSLVPNLLHDYAVVYSPMSYSRDNGVVNIEEVEMEIDQVLYQKLKSR
jgi:hypothetical protein